MSKDFVIDNQPNQTLARAIVVLEAFTLERPEWGIRELARELSINPTTIFRIVTTLLNAGYVERNPETERYALGSKVMRLSRIYSERNPLPLIARKVFESYSGRYDHNIYLGVMRNSEVVYTAVHEGRAPLKVVLEPGGKTSLYTTAIGKVLLASQDDSYIERYLQTTELVAMTPRTITEPHMLLQQIHAARQQGYAINDGEHYDDVASVAAPWRDQYGEVMAAVTLAFPRHLVEQERLNMADLIQLVLEISREITVRYQGEDQT